MRPRSCRRGAVRLFAVVDEDRRTQTVARVLLYAATTMGEAAEMARAFYLADGQPTLSRRFAAQPISLVSGPGGALYRVVLGRHAVA